MKNLSYLSALAILVVAFSACSSSSIEGQWKLAGIELSVNGEEMSLGEADLPPVVLELLADGTYKELGAGGHEGTYEKSDETLTLIGEMGPMEYEILSLNKTELSIKLTIDDDEADIHGSQITHYVRVTTSAEPAPGPTPEDVPAPPPAPDTAPAE